MHSNKDNFQALIWRFINRCPLVESERFLNPDGSVNVVKWKAACLNRCGSITQIKPTSVNHFKVYGNRDITV